MTISSFIDLCSGTGGFSIAIQNTSDLKCVFSNDMIPESQNIHHVNLKHDNFVLKNIHDIDVKDIPKHDMLCAGFPCQPFSIAGEQKGFDDNRSNVFWKITEIAKFHQPEVIILENVKNLKSHDKGNTYKVIETKLKEIGYFVTSKILDTCKITNIPHHRERIYIICFKDESKFNKFNFNFITEKNKKILDFLENTDIPEKYYYTNSLKVYDEIQKNVSEHINSNSVYQYRRYYVRKNKNNCCPTLTANMGKGGHNVPIILDDNGIRKLTPRECFNLQGFPDTYELPTSLSDSKLYSLAGNAISIPVVQLIIQKIIKIYQ
jgi:DNA (cytosine-5)-methyltransferase 1